MPAPASSSIHPVFGRLATLVVPDTVAALPGLLDVLARMAGPRARRGVRHLLVTILAVSVCAVTAGARSLVAIAAWAVDLPTDVADALALGARRVLGRVDGDGLDQVLSTWNGARLLGAPLPADQARRAVAVDGNTSEIVRSAARGARAPRGGRNRGRAATHHGSW